MRLRLLVVVASFVLACSSLEKTDSDGGGVGTPDGNVGEIGAPAVLVASVPSVNIGALDPDAVGMTMVVITNCGGATSGPMTITGSEGVTTSGCSGELEAGASCPLTIFATSPSGGAFHGTVAISADPGAVTPVVVVITGVTTGPPPALRPSPSVVEFGPIPLGFPVPPTEITVSTETGLTDLSFVASGPDISIDEDDTTCTALLAAGTSCVVVVNFAATTVGSKSDAIVFSGGAPAGRTMYVRITAEVVTGTFLVIDSHGAPGAAVPAGEASSPINFVVTNQGDTPTGELHVTVTGPNAAEFVVTSTCAVLYPLVNCAIWVVFQPAATSVGGASATLTVTDTGPSAFSVAVPLHGSVVLPLPELSIAPFRRTAC
jgi:hypothetical protein